MWVAFTEASVEEPDEDLDEDQEVNDDAIWDEDEPDEDLDEIPT